MTWQARPISTHPLQFSLHSAKASCSLVCRDPTHSDHSRWHFLAGQVVFCHCGMSFISYVRFAASGLSRMPTARFTYASSLATFVQTPSQLVGSTWKNGAAIKPPRVDCMRQALYISRLIVLWLARAVQASSHHPPERP